MAITFYVKNGCPYCQAMREDLDGRAAEYNEINVKETPGVVPELLKLTGGRRIVPVLVDGDRVEIAPNGG